MKTILVKIILAEVFLVSQIMEPLVEVDEQLDLHNSQT